MKQLNKPHIEHEEEVTYEVNTMETASFSMDSPKTNMYRMGSTSSAWNIANVATGSTAETKDPNAKLSTTLNLYTTSACGNQILYLSISKYIIKYQLVNRSSKINLSISKYLIK